MINGAHFDIIVDSARSRAGVVHWLKFSTSREWKYAHGNDIQMTLCIVKLSVISSIYGYIGEGLRYTCRCAHSFPVRVFKGNYAQVLYGFINLKTFVRFHPLRVKSMQSFINETPGDHWGIALTSLVFKCCETLFWQHLLDPFQFAYQSNRGAEYTILALLHTVYFLGVPEIMIKLFLLTFNNILLFTMLCLLILTVYRVHK